LAPLLLSLCEPRPSKRLRTLLRRWSALPEQEFMSAPSRQLLLGAVACLIGLALLEGASYVGLAVAEKSLGQEIRRTPAIYKEQSQRIRVLLDRERTGREQIDSLLGWRYRPGYRNADDQVSQQGIRSS